MEGRGCDEERADVGGVQDVRKRDGVNAIGCDVREQERVKLLELEMRGAMEGNRLEGASGDDH